MDTINISPHGSCEIIEEHDREWAVCNSCGAQWAVHESDVEQVTDGDGYCEDRAVNEESQRRHTPECTAVNDASARERCVCPGSDEED